MMRKLITALAITAALALGACQAETESPGSNETDEVSEPAVVIASYTDGDLTVENAVVAEPVDLDSIAAYRIVMFLKDGRALMLDTDTNRVFVACRIEGTTNGYQPCPPPA